jgi:hypothetical protein
MIMDPKAFKSKSMINEIEGYVIERKTTGRKV